MTRAEATAKLALLRNDPEIASLQADNIVHEFLCSNGFADVAEAWTNAESRWVGGNFDPGDETDWPAQK